MTLVPRFQYGDLDLTDYPYSVEFGSDFGNPENVAQVVESLLGDGELVSVDRAGNREIQVTVLVEGTDLAGLAEAEAALVREASRTRNTLSVDPGDGIGAVTIFETFRAEPRWERVDAFEQAYLRRYVLTIPALPYARSEARVVDNANTPSFDGGTLLNSCESTAGWSKHREVSHGSMTGDEIVVDSSVFAEGAGSVRIQCDYSYRNYEIGRYEDWDFGNHDQITGLSMSTDTGGYLSVMIRALPQAVSLNVTRLVMTTTTGTVEIPRERILTTGRDGEGFVRHAWAVDAGLTVTALQFTVFQKVNPWGGSYGEPTPYVWYDDIRLLQAATTDRQIVKQLEVQGSARTEGSLHVAAPADIAALGRVLAITVPTGAVPAGFTPDARRFATSGTTTADTDAPSGSYFTPNGDFGPGGPVFDVPAANYAPGPYMAVMCARIEAGSGDPAVRAQLLIDGAASGPVSEVSAPRSAITIGSYQFIPMGTMYLPPTPMQAPGSTVKVRFEFKGNVSVKVDNLYLIPAWHVAGRPVADYSIVDCGTGSVSAAGASSHLWLDSPSTAQPQGGLWRGPDNTRNNTRSAWADAKKPGVHAFQPGSLTCFVVSTDAGGPTVTLEYFPRWFGSAAS